MVYNVKRNCELKHDVAYMYMYLITSDNLVLQMKNEPDTEIRDPIEDHEPVRHLISPEDGLHVFPSPGNESNHRADAEAEHNGTDVSPTSGDVLRLYDATASGGNSQEHVDHLENALQEYIAKNQKLKEGLKINSRPEDKEKQCGEVAQLSREHATDGESDVEDHQEQRSKRLFSQHFNYNFDLFWNVFYQMQDVAKWQIKDSSCFISFIVDSFCLLTSFH